MSGCIMDPLVVTVSRRSRPFSKRRDESRRCRHECLRHVQAPSSAGWSGGFAQYEFGVDDDFVFGGGTLLGFRNQAVANDVPDLLTRDVHGGERGITELGELDIVEAGDGDVFRDADAALAEFSYSAYRGDVVDADDGGRLATRVEHRERGFAAPFPRVAATHGSESQS